MFPTGGVKLYAFYTFRPITKYYQCDEIEQNELDGIYSAYERDERCMQARSVDQELKGRERLEDLGVSGRTVL